MVDVVDEANACEDEPPIDLTDSTVVFEEIIVYLDVERGGEGAHVYVDDHGEVVQTIMTSVEAKPEVKIDVKMGFEEDMLDNASYANVGHATTEIRGNLASIGEADEAHEGQMDVDSPQQAEEQPCRPRQTIASKSTPQTRKRRREWPKPEIYHIGAWVDAGYTPKAIVYLFGTTFPDAERITPRMVYRRHCATFFVEDYKEIMSLGRKLGLESGKWERMYQELA